MEKIKEMFYIIGTAYYIENISIKGYKLFFLLMLFYKLSDGFINLIREIRKH